MSDDRAVKALERRMNRPLALALASLVVTIGVFFAGFTLIANSPKVTFNPALAVTTPAAGQTRVLPVSLDQGTSGTTATDSVSAALKRGGEATPAAATPSGDVGQVGFKRTSSSSQTRATTTTAKSTTKAKPKKTAKRAISIGADSGP
jgi:hypothetical protein